MNQLAKAFAGLKELQEPEAPGPRALKTPGTREPKLKPGPRMAPTPSEPTGKRSDPKYIPVKVFIRKATHRAAGRKWEDAEQGDFSDLVEHLLQRYLDT